MGGKVAPSKKEVAKRWISDGANIAYGLLAAGVFVGGYLVVKGIDMAFNAAYQARRRREIAKQSKKRMLDHLSAANGPEAEHIEKFSREYGFHPLYPHDDETDTFMMAQCERLTEEAKIKLIEKYRA